MSCALLLRATSVARRMSCHGVLRRFVSIVKANGMASGCLAANASSRPLTLASDSPCKFSSFGGNSFLKATIASRTRRAVSIFLRSSMPARELVYWPRPLRAVSRPSSEPMNPSRHLTTLDRNPAATCAAWRGSLMRNRVLYVVAIIARRGRQQNVVDPFPDRRQRTARNLAGIGPLGRAVDEQFLDRLEKIT